MEKFILRLFLFLFVSNSVLSQTITVFDKEKEPIYNVSFYKKDLSKGNFTNFLGEIDLSDYSDSDSIIIQHPSFEKIIILKSDIENNSIELSSKIIEIKELVFSVNRWEENLNDVTNKTLIIPESVILQNSPQTSADLLEQTGEVFVQKSQLGGGSPMIRGFSANRILLSLDGSRLNNVIYRSGNIHNIISIDPNILAGVEVLFGPASVMYGSDAIGGAINFQVKDPRFSINKTKINGSQNVQYNSSSNSKHYNINFGISKKNIASLTSFSYSSFQNLRSGAKRNKKYPNFGLRDEYVIRDEINDRDEIVINENVNVQKFSGYSQINLINKINLKLNEQINVLYGLYLSNSSNIPRFDRLIIYDDLFTPRYSEWYYGPDLFLMNKLQINSFKKNRIFDAYKINLSHQLVRESRHTRRFNDNYLKNRNEEVKIFSINADFDKKNNGSELYYGIESIINKVNSNANQENIVTNEKINISTRYPDNGSDYFSNSIYMAYKRKLGDIKTNMGIRGNISNLKSQISSSFFDFPITEINVNSSSMSGNIGFRYDLNSSVFKFQYSNGFRTPNLDDVGKIFDSEPGNVIMPNPNLKPEHANNFEFNYEINKGKLSMNNSIYYIRLNNAIIRSNGSFNGNDSIIYDGINSRIQTLTNGGKAFVIGFSNNISIKLNDNITIENSISYNNSKDILNDRPLRHSPPLFGKTSLTFSKKTFKIIYHLNYNGKKDIEDFSQSELNKLYLYTNDGSPAWMTHNISFSYNYNYFIKFNFSIENIFDIHYRTYSSGISAPGRNVNIGLNFKF